jgi:hypothetical protein
MVRPIYIGHLQAGRFIYLLVVYAYLVDGIDNEFTDKPTSTIQKAHEEYFQTTRAASPQALPTKFDNTHMYTQLLTTIHLCARDMRSHVARITIVLYYNTSQYRSLKMAIVDRPIHVA